MTSRNDNSRRPRKIDVEPVRPLHFCALSTTRFCAFYDFTCPTWAVSECLHGTIAFRLKTPKRTRGAKP